MRTSWDLVWLGLSLQRGAVGALGGAALDAGGQRAVRGDEADLAQRQPQANGQRHREGSEKEKGEVGGHEMRCEAMRK